MFKIFKKGQRGFTLIELLIVIAILGILVAIAVPNVSNFIDKGTAAAANAELSVVRLAAQVAAAASPTGQITTAPYTATPAIPGVIAPYLSGSPLKGNYAILANGTVDFLAAATRYPATGTARTKDTTNLIWQ